MTSETLEQVIEKPTASENLKNGAKKVINHDLFRAAVYGFISYEACEFTAYYSALLSYWDSIGYTSSDQPLYSAIGLMGVIAILSGAAAFRRAASWFDSHTSKKDGHWETIWKRVKKPEDDAE